MSSAPPPNLTEPSEPSRPVRQIPISERLWNAPAALVLGFAFALLGTILVETIGSAFGSPVAHPTAAVSLIGDFVFDGAFVTAALYFSSLGGLPRAADFGYRTVSWRLGLAAFALAGGGYYLLTLVYGTLLDLKGSDKLPSELGVTHHTAALVAAIVFVCVAAPMAEEFFFRGFFFGTLSKMRVKLFGREAGPWIAALITGILFGLAHTGSASPQYLVPLGFLGFVLCIVRWKTGSLYPCMALHSCNNCLALGVNQEHWGVGPIIALMFGSLAVIALCTGPLALRGARRAAAAGTA
jgi:membrane protease YdiL (CAAX protease family)